MGKPTGFLDYQPEYYLSEAPGERIRHFKEFISLPAPEAFSRQGARCMDCGIPFCHSEYGCPVYNLIPEWNDLVYRDLWQEAYNRLEQTNNFPEFTGRLCPAPCETACTLSINDHPVTIKNIELAIIEQAFSSGWVIPKPPGNETGKRIAVIGSGPAGLAAAQQLRRSGHDVTVFEKSPMPGGLLRYGIPDFKLEKWIIDRRLEQLEQEGITFETNIDVGEDISARFLVKSFDAILLATGAGEPRRLEVPGADLAGIHLAMDYLTRSNMFVAGKLGETELITARDKNVLVIGGGDTGSDCIGTANRQGARHILQVEILPKPAEHSKPCNPAWPGWPNIMRTSSSHEEGCEREWGIATRSFQGDHHGVKRVHFNRVEWIAGKNNGNLDIKEIRGSGFSREFELVILAMGFVHVEHNRLLKQFNIEFDQKGNILTDARQMSTVAGVFAAGDAAAGASLIVRAIYQGRRAARAINAYLGR